MGKKWRRFNEGLRQRFVSHPYATSNERNRQMLREADNFARSLRKVDGQLGRVEESMRGLSMGMKNLLESPAPRPYIISDTGETIRETSEFEIVGAGVQVERITTASEVMAMRLNAEVNAPLREWLDAFDKAKVLIHEVERIRVELDSRRRTVATLEAKANNIRARLDKGDGNRQKSFEVVEKKLRHKEEKYASNRAEYEQLEQECSSALRALLKDSVNLRDFLAQSYKVLFETSQEAYAGFSQSHPMPGQAYGSHPPYVNEPYRPSHNIASAPGSPPPHHAVSGGASSPPLPPSPQMEGGTAPPIAAAGGY